MDDVYIGIGAVGIFIFFYLLPIHPINRRHQRVLDHLLAKEIARSIYQKLHPDFRYDKYLPSNLREELLISIALKEFIRLETEE